MDELGHRAARRRLGGARRAGGLGGDRLLSNLSSSADTGGGSPSSERSRDSLPPGPANTKLPVPVGQFRPCQEHVPESAETRSKTLEERVTDLHPGPAGAPAGQVSARAAAPAAPVQAQAVRTCFTSPEQVGPSVQDLGPMPGPVLRASPAAASHPCARLAVQRR
jgi:hypothetical protein